MLESPEPVARSKWLLWPTLQVSDTLQLIAMAYTAEKTLVCAVDYKECKGQRHALNGPLWPAPQASGTSNILLAMADTAGGKKILCLVYSIENSCSVYK